MEGRVWGKPAMSDPMISVVLRTLETSGQIRGSTAEEAEAVGTTRWRIRSVGSVRFVRRLYNLSLVAPIMAVPYRGERLTIHGNVYHIHRARM